MKKIVLSVLALCLASVAVAQEVDSTGSTLAQPVRKPLELAWEQTEVGDFSKTVSYVHQRNADVMYYHTIWRTIDLREKMNHPLYFPQETRGTWRSLGQVIFDAIDIDHPEKSQDSVLPVYTDEFCTMYKDREAVRAALSETRVIDLMDDETFEIVGQQEIHENYQAKQILQYRVKEIWFFDKKRSVMEVRILEIEPMIQVEREVGGQGAPIPGQEEQEEEDVQTVKAWKRLGFLMYDELRPYLVKQEMYNPKNNAQRLSLDDVLTWKREFSSFIYQEQNTYNDRQIYEYIANARDQRIESERITEKIRSFEHDLWEF